MPMVENVRKVIRLVQGGGRVYAALSIAMLAAWPRPVQAATPAHVLWPAPQAAGEPQAGASVSIDAQDPRDIVAGFNDYTTPRGLSVCWSSDGGRTWGLGNLPDLHGGRLGDPEVLAAPDHVFYLSATSYRYDALGRPTAVVPALFISSDGGQNWRLLAMPGQKPMDGRQGAEDAPVAAVDPAGTIAMAWTRFRPGVASIVVAVSHDQGRTFRQAAQIKTGFARGASIVAEGVGRFLVAFDEAAGQWIGAAQIGGGQVSVRRVARYTRLPSALPSFAFRINGLPRLARDTARNRVYITWGTLRDGRASVMLAASPDGGAHWDTPRPLDAPGTTDTFLPAVAAANGQLGALFYGVVRTASGPAYQAYLVMSSDGGRHLGGAMPLAGQAVPLGTHDPWYLGDYPGLAIAGWHVVTLWTGRQQAVQRIYTRLIPLQTGTG